MNSPSGNHSWGNALRLITWATGENTVSLVYGTTVPGPIVTKEMIKYSYSLFEKHVQ